MFNRLMPRYLETVVFDAAAGEVAITFRAGGPKAVALRPTGDPA